MKRIASHEHTPSSLMALKRKHSTSSIIISPMPLLNNNTEPTTPKKNNPGLTEAETISLLKAPNRSSVLISRKMRSHVVDTRVAKRLDFSNDLMCSTERSCAPSGS